MPIIDVNAWTGHWPTFPVEGAVETVRQRLIDVGVDLICMAPLDAVWCHNPHHLNDMVYDAAVRFAEIVPAPVIDPTIASWPEELDRAVGAEAVLVKLVPAYSGYELASAGKLLDAVQAASLPVMVQVRLEDPRRNHPLARVPDFPAGQIAEMAQQRPDLAVIIGGATTSGIIALREQLQSVPRLFVDISQADGMDAVQRMVDAGLERKLVFGSHVPLFEPLAALARVLPELGDEAAAAVLGGNAAALLRHQNAA